MDELLKDLVLREKLAQWLGFIYGTIPDFPNDFNACEKWIMPKLKKPKRDLSVDFLKSRKWWCVVEAFVGETYIEREGRGGSMASAFCQAVEQIVDTQREWNRVNVG